MFIKMRSSGDGNGLKCSPNHMRRKILGLNHSIVKGVHWGSLYEGTFRLITISFSLVLSCVSFRNKFHFRYARARKAGGLQLHSLLYKPYFPLLKC